MVLDRFMDNATKNDQKRPMFNYDMFYELKKKSIETDIFQSLS